VRWRIPISPLFPRQAAVLASAVIYWAGVIVHARRVRKQIGRSPNIKPRTLKEMALWFGWFLVIAGWMGQPLIIGNLQTGVLFSPSAHLLRPFGLFLGIFIALCGHLGTLWCYASLGDSWRIGVNGNERTALVTGGPYRLARHPIYLFQVMILIGMLVLLPTLFSFAILLVHSICVVLKALDEERHLLAIHGHDYDDYRSRTGMLFPGWKSLLLILRMRQEPK